MTKQGRMIGWGLCLWLVLVSLGAAPAEDRTAELAGQLRPFVECLSGRAEQFCLVLCYSSIDGYSRLSFMRASAVVNCQFTFVAAASRAASHALASRRSC